MANNSPKLGKELENAAKQFDKFDDQVKAMTLDRMNEAPKEDKEPQSRFSQKELSKTPDHYIKPSKHLGDGQKFNERFREQWEYAKEYVHFTAYHSEIIGEKLEFWTHPFGGVGAQYWEIPTGKPIWAPRHVAEQIRRCKYHQLVMMENTITSADGIGQMYGSIAADSTIQRLNAEPVIERKSIFMGASNF